MISMRDSLFQRVRHFFGANLLLIDFPTYARSAGDGKCLVLKLFYTLVVTWTYSKFLQGNFT